MQRAFSLFISLARNRTNGNIGQAYNEYIFGLEIHVCIPDMASADSHEQAMGDWKWKKFTRPALLN